MNVGLGSKYSFERIIKLFFSFSFGVWINALLNFFALPIITYLISPSEFGKAAMYAALYSFLLVITMAGADQSYSRFFYQFEEENRAELLGSSMLVPFIIFFSVSVFLFFASPKLSVFFVGSRDEKFGFIMAISLLSGILQTFSLATVRMKKRGVVFSLSLIIQSLFNICVIVAYSYFIEKNFYALVWGQISANTSSFLFVFIMEHSFFRKLKVKRELIKEILSYGFPLMPGLLTYWAFTWISRISIRMFSSFKEIGYFAAALKIVALMNLVQVGFQNIWTPIAFESYEHDKENTEIYRKASVIVSFLMLFLAGIIILFKDEITLIFTQDYRPASQVLPFLTLMPVVFSVSAITTKGINFSKKTYWFTISYALSAIFNLLLNIGLTPLYGAKGAALATSISYVIHLLIATHISMRLFPVNYPLRKIYFSLLILIGVSYVNTFVASRIVGSISSILGLFAVLAIYQDTARDLMLRLRSHLKR